MLENSQILALENRSESVVVFNDYLKKAHEFCDFLLENEGIKAQALPKSQVELVKNHFFKFPLEVQKHKYEFFKKSFQIYKELREKRISLKNKKETLFSFLKKYGLRVPRSQAIFDLMDNNTFFEVYDNHFTQVFRSIDFMKLTSHGLMALESCDWFCLFERSKNIIDQQMVNVRRVFSGNLKTCIFYPVDRHTVKEINSPSPKTSLSESLVYAPVYGLDGKSHGGLHLFKVFEQRSLEFKVIG